MPYKDPEKIKEYGKLYRLRHRDYFRNYSKKYKLGLNEEQIEKRKKYRSNYAKFYKKYSDPLKVKARTALRNAIRLGKLTKPKLCITCKIENKLEGHHPDYSKPLEVEWLCKSCHENKHHN